MENEQTQELSNTKVADSSVVADKFNIPEFTRVNQEKEPIEKLAEAIETKPEIPDPNSQTELSNKDSVKTDELPPKKEAFDHEKWDGKIDSLPENIQKIVKDTQAMATSKAQEAAQLKKELEQRTVQIEAAKDQPLITQEEYEEAQLSPTKFVEVINRLAARAIDKKAAELMPVISQVQHTQLVAENEKAINDFAKEHEDFWELHDASPKLFMALISQNKNLSETYETLKQFQQARDDKAKKTAQTRVQEKKNASTFGRTSKHTENIMYIEGSQDDVLRKQVELTLEGKNIQVRLKK